MYYNTRPVAPQQQQQQQQPHFNPHSVVVPQQSVLYPTQHVPQNQPQQQWFVRPVNTREEILDESYYNHVQYQYNNFLNSNSIDFRQVSPQSNEPSAPVLYPAFEETELQEPIPTHLVYQRQPVYSTTAHPLQQAKQQPQKQQPVYYPVETEQYRTILQNSTGSFGAPVAEKEESQVLHVDKQNLPSNYAVHKLHQDDSLSTIALQYGVTVESIKMANNILSDLEYINEKELIIPFPMKIPDLEKESVVDAQLYEQQKRKWSMKFFLQVLKTSEEEAKYYLSLHEFDFQAALQEYRDDVKWEKQQLEQRKLNKKQIEEEKKKKF